MSSIVHTQYSISTYSTVSIHTVQSHSIVSVHTVQYQYIHSTVSVHIVYTQYSISTHTVQYQYTYSTVSVHTVYTQYSINTCTLATVSILLVHVSFNIIQLLSLVHLSIKIILEISSCMYVCMSCHGGKSMCGQVLK